MHKKRGYTIIELIVVLALFSLMFCIALPSLKTFTKVKEDIEIRKFKKDLYYSRNQAIVHNCRYYVVLNYSSNSYEIKREDDLIETVVLEEIDLISTTQVEFVFGGTGAPLVSGSVQFWSNDNSTKYEIAVAPVTGKISIYK